MPRYEYKCEGCGEVFELQQKFADEPLTVHDKCGARVERIISAPALMFKGSGFYVNDYAKGGGNGGTKKSESETLRRHGREIRHQDHRIEASRALQRQIKIRVANRSAYPYSSVCIRGLKKSLRCSGNMKHDHQTAFTRRNRRRALVGRSSKTSLR